MQHVKDKDKAGVQGYLTIRKFKNGELVYESPKLPNKVVSGSGGYGRNLLARQLAGDTTYPLEIDSASLGDDNTAPVDANTDLGNPLVEDIPLTNVTVLDDVVTVDVFVADANLPDDTYGEMGFFCNGRLFSRIIIQPAYTKASGEDTLFTYELQLS